MGFTPSPVKKGLGDCDCVTGPVFVRYNSTTTTDEAIRKKKKLVVAMVSRLSQTF